MGLQTFENKILFSPPAAVKYNSNSVTKLMRVEFSKRQSGVPVRF
jgi:hypothetical protein